MKRPIPLGKYLLLERVNVGGMAEVFVAKAFGVEGFERLLAIKKILPTMVEDEEFITMFIDEARIAVQLNHANIAQIYELGKVEAHYFIAMEYVSGRDLRMVLDRYRRRNERMPFAQAAFIISKLAEGLDYAHRKKDARGEPLHIIHRDVSPQNVLLSYEGEVKLIDFGIAKAANRLQQTQAGILKGKFGYMSPEQVRGHALDRRSDVFALGALLYECLTGEKAFQGASDYSTLDKVRNAIVIAPRKRNAELPPALERVVFKALARDVEDRYQWASELQEDLLRFLQVDDASFSSKTLSANLRAEFAEELAQEKVRLESFVEIARPENSAVSTTAPAPELPAAGTEPAARDDRTQLSMPGFGDDPTVGSGARRRTSVATGASQPAGDDSPPTLGAPADTRPEREAVEPTDPLANATVVSAAGFLSAASGAPDDGDPTIATSPELVAAAHAAIAAVDAARAAMNPVSPPMIEPVPLGGATIIHRDVTAPDPPAAAQAPEVPIAEQPTQIGASAASAARGIGDRQATVLAARVPSTARPPPDVRPRRLLFATAALALLLVLLLALKLLSGEGEGEGTLVVHVEPMGAPFTAIEIDGVVLGRASPLVAKLVAGEHTVRVLTPEGPHEARVELDEGAAREVRVRLPAKPLREAPPPKSAPAIVPSSTKERPARTATAPAIAEPAPSWPPPGPKAAASVKRAPPRVPPARGTFANSGTPFALAPDEVTQAPRSTAAPPPGAPPPRAIRVEGEHKHGGSSPAIDAPDEHKPRRATSRKSKTPRRDLAEREPAIRRPQREPPRERARDAATRSGFLILSSTPTAKVFVDGRDTGQWTPVPPARRLELPAGEHRITFRAADGREVSRRVVIRAGELAKLVGVEL